MTVITLLLIGLFIIRLLTRTGPAWKEWLFPSSPMPEPEPLPKGKPGKPFITNAPAHWGNITDEFLITNRQAVEALAPGSAGHALQQRQFMLNSLQLLGGINSALEKHIGEKPHTSYSNSLLGAGHINATSCCIQKLLPKGIISIAGIVVDNHVRYAVILLDTPTPVNYIEELKRYIVEDGYYDLIWYALTDPATVTETRKLTFESFNKSCFSINKDKQGAVNRSHPTYALWWAGDTSQYFPESALRKDMETYLDLIDHHNSYALGILSYAFGLSDSNSRIAMPDLDQVIMEGPEGVEIVLTVSKDRGMVFHFPVKPIYERYRNNFIKVFVDFCYSIRAQVLEHDLPDDDFGQSSSLLWFRKLVADVERDKDHDVAVVGVLGKW